MVTYSKEDPQYWLALEGGAVKETVDSEQQWEALKEALAFDSYIPFTLWDILDTLYRSNSKEVYDGPEASKEL